MTGAFIAGAIEKLAAGVSERKWHEAKAHVARGHEAERRRLQRRGLAVGTAAGLATAAANSLLRKRLDPLSFALLPAGAAIGHLGGGAVADRRLILSQSRESHGHYAPREKVGAAIESSLSETAKKTRMAVAAVKRPHIIPPTPDAPKPQALAPAIEPSTLIPGPVKMSALKKARGRKTPESLGEPQDNQWSGSLFQPYRRGPENEPVGQKAHDF